MVYRIYVEKKAGLAAEADSLRADIVNLLGISSLKGLRLLNRYDVERIDRDLFESLLVNLIDNGIKASDEGGVIFLTGQDNVITVRDEGCGIPADEIKRVTEAFYMVDKARSRKEGGCGLGLALCSMIAELHGAKLAIESEVGRGTSVSVIF